MWNVKCWWNEKRSKLIRTIVTLFVNPNDDNEEIKISGSIRTNGPPRDDLLETKKQRRSIMSSLVIGRAKRVICRVHQTGLQFNDIRGASHASTRRFSVSQSKNRTSFKPYSSLKHTKHPLPPPPKQPALKSGKTIFENIRRLHQLRHKPRSKTVKLTLAM